MFNLDKSAIAPSSPRYAWVLAGCHEPLPPGVEPSPRSEFAVFLERFGGVLLSRSDLGRALPPVVGMLRRAAMPSMSLACLVQSKASGFDAILASGEDIGVPLALASLAGRSRTPIHMMFHGHHLGSRKLRLLAPILRQMRHVHFHCLSHALMERTLDELGIPRSRCHATGYGIDTDYFAGGPVAEGALIASAGAANRDYATLAAAVRGLPVAVRIAADSTWVRQTPEEPAASWPKNIEARSYGDYARLRALYGDARFVVVPLHPARHACGYAVIAEAMAMGRAVIATRTDCPPDFLHPKQTGLFAEAHDVAGLRRCILDLLEHPDEAAAMGQRARALMIQAYSVETYCDRLERIVAASIQESR